VSKSQQPDWSAGRIHNPMGSMDSGFALARPDRKDDGHWLLASVQTLSGSRDPGMARNVIKTRHGAERTSRCRLISPSGISSRPCRAVVRDHVMSWEMEVEAGDAINEYLEPVCPGRTEVDIRHSRGSDGRRGDTNPRRCDSRLESPRVIRLEVEAFAGERRIGEGP